MTRPRTASLLGLLALVSACGNPSATGGGDAERRPGAAVNEPTGVVVEAAEAGFAADEAGLQPGDLLLRWERAASPPDNPTIASGDLSSPFDLDAVEMEEGPRGALTLTGARAGEDLRVRLVPGQWRLRSHPPLAQRELAAYESAKALVAEGKIDEGLSRWGLLASALGERGVHHEAAWLHLRIAEAAGEKADWPTADEAFERAGREAEASGRAAVRALVADAQANSLRARSQLDLAAERYQEALEIRQASSPTSLGIARSLNSLGTVALYRGDLAGAERYYRQALGVRESLAPGSFEAANSLANVGLVAGNRGDLAMAEHYLRRSLDVQERLAPQSPEVARGLNNLGIAALYRGDLAAAEGFHRRALAILEELDPQSVDMARFLNNLGLVASERGDLAAAEDAYRRSLVVLEKLEAESLDLARLLNNLGTVASRRGELGRAEDYHRRALAIRERLAPQSLEVGESLGNLGNAAFDREELAAAEAYYRRALAIFEERAPGSVDTAEALQRLGDIALARSNPESAEARYERSLEIRRDLAPGSALEAEGCRRLADLHRRRNRIDRALAFYGCAIEALEAQRGKLGGSDQARSGFAALYARHYREAIDLLVEVGQTDEAFHVLERYRARERLAMLSMRDLVFRSSLPAELERRRRVTDAHYDRVFEQLKAVSANGGSEDVARVQEELRAVRLRQEEIRAEIRAASPRLAALQDPQPIDLDGAVRTLDPGTVLLSYSVGQERSTLFALGPEGELEAHILEAGEAQLREEISRLRTWIGRRSRQGELEAARRRLSVRLLEPAAARIARAERLMILADGPLHSLPFAVLADPTGESRFLVEAKPLHLVASASVLALLQEERHDRRATRLIAFGDPRYPPGSQPEGRAEAQVNAALRKGLKLTPLPASREEVEGIRNLYPRSSEIYLGAEATEERVKAVGRETTHLHIAGHGLLDDRFPLDSALAFSIPVRWRYGQDNGLLQAWEIFEQMRIDADLVTLSACETGLGEVLGGEGLMGLARAFQFAGARSILASLWSVEDRSTAELMMRFYGYLKEGQSKAEALRSAQLDLLRSAAFAHPFHWAGFELFGDWL